MRRISFLVLLFLISFGLVSCAREKNDSNSPMQLLMRLLFRNALAGSAINPNLPSNLAVALPRSIRKVDSSGSFAVRSVGGKSFSGKSASTAIEDGNTGLSVLQEGTTIIGAILQDSKRDLVILSGVYDLAKANPGVCIPGGRSSVVVSDLALQEFLDGLTRTGLSQDEAAAELSRLQSQGILPRVGQTIPSPAVVYRVPDEQSYDHQVDFSFSETLSTPKPCPGNPNARNAFDKTIKWKDDKSQIFSLIQKRLRFFNIDINVTASITYFTSATGKDRSILNMKQEVSYGRGATAEESKVLTVEECQVDSDANTDNCVSLNFRAKEKSASANVQTTIKGKTGNQGGYVKTTIEESGGAGFTFEVEEVYDPEGNIQYISFFDGTFTTEFGELTDIYNIYAFDENNLFDSFIQVVLGLTGSPDRVGCEDNTCTTPLPFDFFVIVNGSNSPENNEESEVGYGFFSEADNPADGYTDASELEVYFWGEEAMIPNLTVWRLTFDSENNITYKRLYNVVSKL